MHMLNSGQRRLSPELAKRIEAVTAYDDPRRALDTEGPEWLAGNIENGQILHWPIDFMALWDGMRLCCVRSH
jgi:hypothetical protein